MYPDAFDELLAIVKPRIRKQVTNWRLPIPADVRLSIALRYLAQGK